MRKYGEFTGKDLPCWPPANRFSKKRGTKARRAQGKKECRHGY